MKRLLGCLAILAVTAPGCLGMTTASPFTDDDATAYMMRYGYMGEKMPDTRVAALMDTNPEMAKELGIKMFQAKYEAYGLNITGELDEPTRTLMSYPRCGMVDMMMMEDMPGMDLDGYIDDDSEERRRRRRYVLGGGRWASTDLTYRFESLTPDLNSATAISEIERGLQVWADVSPLTFTRVQSGGDILISFASRSHGDGEPFDGPSGVLAHAYFPFNGGAIEGDAHFDEDESWTAGTNSGINLFQVAAHEFGHSLGLSHSEIDAALMAPFYQGFVPNFQLHRDDIAGIQAIYGTPDSGMDGDDGMGGPDDGGNTDAPVTNRPGVPDFCANPRLDAMTAHIENGQLANYAFQGDYYARLDNADGILPGYPRLIADDWQGITGGIDAALYLPAHNTLPAHTLLFKGPRYYIYSADMTFVNDRSLNSFDLPADMDGVDAAFVWGRNGRIYVMRGSRFYRLKRRNNDNVNKLLKMNKGYPKSLSRWDLPVDSIDGAQMYPSNGYTYFFKDQQYYRYNDANQEVDEANPPYPRDIGTWWLGCQNAYRVEDNENDPNGVASTSTSVFIIIYSLVVTSFYV